MAAVEFALVVKLILVARRLALDPDIASRAEALADLMSSADALDGALGSHDLAPIARRMEQRARDLDRHITHPGPALDDARALFAQAAPHALADPALLAANELDPQAACSAMIARIHASPVGRDFRQAAFAESYFRQIMETTLAQMLADRDIIDAIAPGLWRETLRRHGIQIALLTGIDDTTRRTEAKLDHQTERLARIEALLAERIAPDAAGVPQATILALVHRMAPSVTDIEDALTQLRRAVEIASRFLEQGRHGSNIDAFVAEVLAELTRLTEAGDLDAAARLARVRLSEANAGVARLRQAAIDTALIADAAEDAAALIAERVAEDTPDQAARFDALRAEFGVWYERGRDAGLALDLRVAIALAETARDRAATPDQRGAALTDLGAALTTLGARESGTDRLQEAVDACRSALREMSRDRVPLDWATAQMNLGVALRTLGARESATVRLQEAVDAYRAALEVVTRDRVPLQWARAQTNLGAVLRTLGERESGTDRLQEAVDAFRAALQEITRDQVPLDWATTQANLGNALATLGERESGTGRLQEAVDACEAALQEWTRDRLPLQWAMTQMNLGTALATLGERESGTDRLEQAVASYEAALQERTRDRAPLDWAMTQMNLGAALQTLGERKSGKDRLEAAVAAYEAALQEMTRDRVPLQWATTRYNIALAHRTLFDRTGDPADLAAARAAVAEALEVFTEAGTIRYIELATRLRDALAAL